MICSFFGHKDTPSSVYLRLIDTIKDLIVNRGVSSFIVGNQGDFDSMVLKALHELKQLYPHICYNVVFAYMPSEKQKYKFYDSVETFLPEGIECVPKRFAISWRNKWMIRESQLVVCYISRSWGWCCTVRGICRKARQGDNQPCEQRVNTGDYAMKRLLCYVYFYLIL